MSNGYIMCAKWDHSGFDGAIAAVIDEWLVSALC